jgi:CBS domain-containing protein
MQELVEAVVRDRAGEDLISVAASASVADAVALMSRREVGAVLIVTEDGLVGGIFTERDLLMRVVAAGRDPKTTPISLVMTRDVQFVSPGTSVEAALSLMYVQHHRHMLVIDGPKVHGLVSMRDLVYRLVRHGQGRFEAAIRQAAAVHAPRADPDNIAEK